MFGGLNEKFQFVSIGISGPTNGKDYTYTALKDYNPQDMKARIPLHLKEACQTVSHCPVWLANDAVIWLHGALFWQQLTNQKVGYPALGITLGTGVGAAINVDEKTVFNLPLGRLNIPYRSIIYGQIFHSLILASTIHDS